MKTPTQKEIEAMPVGELRQLVGELQAEKTKTMARLRELLQLVNFAQQTLDEAEKKGDG